MMIMMTPPQSPRARARETSGSSASTPIAGPLRSVWSFTHTFTIGRSRSSDVVIPTTDKTRTVSKSHVRIFPVRDSRHSGASMPSYPVAQDRAAGDRKPIRWVLQDLETTNGTSLNGVDLTHGGSLELHDGDVFVLASMMRNGARIAVQLPYEDGSTIRVKVVEQSTASTPEQNPHQPVNYTRSSPQFRTPTSSGTTPRYSSSTVATKRERHQRDSIERRRGARNTNSNELMEDVDEVVQRKRSRRLEELDDQERCMVCPICFEYFQSSVTLPCSHTFCGFCVSNWFRASLSCPQCRADVTSLPVRNRALDDLVHRLAGETEGYKALIAKRLRVQSQMQCEPRPQSPALLMPNFRNPFLSDSPSTASHPSTSTAVVAVSDATNAPLPNVFTRWKPEEIARVRSIVSKQFGETRLQTCRRMGLTEESMARASTSQTAIAMQNLLLDWWPYERVRDEGNHRLKIFLHFG